MALTPGQWRLYVGDYNSLEQAWQPDGSVVVRISGGKSGQVHLVHVRELWGKAEEVLTEEVLPSGVEAHIEARLDEAGRML